MPGLLDTIKILDFTSLMPGPYATMLLADLGAEVLRIESPTRIDLTRLAPPFVDQEGRLSAMHAYLNRNKRSLALDLKQPFAATIINRLIREQGYDVVIEAFRPGVMQRLGLSYADLAASHPGLIYCSLNGYGQSGPLKDKAGHDINYVAQAGLMSYSGTPQAGPVLMGVQVADVCAGSQQAVIAILSALIGRMHTGKGQYLDIAMHDGLLALQVMQAAAVLAHDPDPQYASGILDGASLYGFYATRDERYIAFGGLEPQFQLAFLEVLGIAHPGAFASEHAQRELKERIRTVIASQDMSFWVSAFETVDACVSPVLTLSEALNSAQTASRSMRVSVPAQDGTPITQIACPLHFSQFTPEYRHAGGEPGVDTAAVLTSLGYALSELEALQAQGVIAGIAKCRCDSN